MRGKFALFSFRAMNFTSLLHQKLFLTHPTLHPQDSGVVGAFPSYPSSHHSRTSITTRNSIRVPHAAALSPETRLLSPPGGANNVLKSPDTYSNIDAMSGLNINLACRGEFVVKPQVWCFFMFFPYRICHESLVYQKSFSTTYFVCFFLLVFIKQP